MESEEKVISIAEKQVCNISFLKRTESGTIRIMQRNTVLAGFSENDPVYKA